MPKRAATYKPTARRIQILHEQEEHDRLFEQFAIANRISNSEERNRTIARIFLLDSDAANSDEATIQELASQGAHTIEWFRQMLMQAFEENGVVKVSPYQLNLDLES